MGHASPVPRQTSAQEENEFPRPQRQEGPCKRRNKLLNRASVDDLEMWLEFQAGQLGTPTWWEELGAMPGIEDWHKFAWKIRASFYVPEVQLRASPEWAYTVPLAPQSLNRSPFQKDLPTNSLCSVSPTLGGEA